MPRGGAKRSERGNRRPIFRKTLPEALEAAKMETNDREMDPVTIVFAKPKHVTDIEVECRVIGVRVWMFRLVIPVMNYLRQSV